MTTNANWLNIDPIEDESDDGPVLQPHVQVPMQKFGTQKLGETVWFGQQPAATFSLSLDLTVPKGK